MEIPFDEYSARVQTHLQSFYGISIVTRDIPDRARKAAYAAAHRVPSPRQIAARINSCWHPDLAHYAFGLCVACYRRSPKGRAVQKRYANSPKGKESRARYARTPKVARIKEHMRPPTMFRVDLRSSTQIVPHRWHNRAIQISDNRT